MRIVLLLRQRRTLSAAVRIMIVTTVVRYILAAQSIVMLLSAGRWWQAWQCPCETSLRDAAFWTGLVMAQGVVLIAYLALRSRQTL